MTRLATVALGTTLLLGLATTLAGDRAPDYTVRFVPMASPAGPGSLAPRLTRTPGGTVLLSWLEPTDGDRHALRFASLAGDRWSRSGTVATGANWFVNWADVPSVTPITERDFVAHWLVRRPGSSYAYDVALAISRDAGATWGRSFQPHDDGTATEHGFVSLFPWEDGFGVVWLDGRNTRPGAGGGPPGAMTVRYARYGFDGRIRTAGELDTRACDCCATDVATVAGSPVATYRDRTADEIRDIAVSRFADGAWQPPVILGNDGWKIAGCPVNGSTLDARGSRVAVAWYTAPEQQRRVQLAWSADGGRSFGDPVVVEAGAVNGYVDVALAGPNLAVVSWAGKSPAGTGQLRLRRVPFAGPPGPVQVVAEGEMGRGSGFPRLAVAPDRLVHAWTRPGEPSAVLTAWSLLP